MITRPFALGPKFDPLPDDTEETLVGSSLHQGAIVALYTSLQQCGPQRGLPWFIGYQIQLIIPRLEGRAPYQPSPDMLIHPTLTDAPRDSLHLSTDGPPALVIEVASPLNVIERDFRLTSPTGKAGVYEAIGVNEYLVFDPDGDVLETQVWARHAGPGGFVPWEADANGRWVSTALGIAFGPRGVLLRAYDQDGRLVLTTEEMADVIDAQNQRLAELEEKLRQLRGS